MPKLRTTILALLFGFTVASGQSPDAKVSLDLSTEIAKLNKAVREIADLLAKQTEGQKVELLMKRVELASSKLSQLEQRESSLQSEKMNIEDQAYRLVTEMKLIQDRVPASPDESQRLDLETTLARGEAEGKRLADRVQSLSQQIGDVENQLTAQREELKTWQQVVDRSLGGT
jgi:chromosome segregation ATPase